MFTRFIAAIVLSLAFLLSTTQAAPLPVSNLVVFGDSLSDVGSFYLGSLQTIPSTPPYYQGRFTNGPVWVERLASNLGLPLPISSLTGGSNYAIAGAESGSGMSLIASPNIQSQILLYLSTKIPAADDLFIVWGGSNDFLLAGQTDPAITAINMAANISMLANAGAKNILTLNLPPLYAVPAANGVPSSFVFTPDDLYTRSAAFNALYSDALDALMPTLPSDVNLIRFDLGSLFEQIVANYALYGLTNVSDPAFNENVPSLVPDPEHYLFWDGAHPTAVVHQALGDVISSIIIPEPASISLISLPAIALLRRRQAA